MNIRPVRPEDADRLWAIFSEVVAGGDTYVFDETLTRTEAVDYWMGEGAECFVAEEDGAIYGAHLLRSNRPGRGAHIGNASFMVAREARGRGVGELLGRHCIEAAIKKGFDGIQFNFVVSTNEAAVVLWKKLGWEVIGVVPGGFRHKTRGKVDVFIMYRSLEVR